MAYPKNVNLPRSLTPQDFAALTRVARSEAGGLNSDRDAGLQAVIDTILNRVASPSFPNSVSGVVNQGAERVNGSQFTPVAQAGGSWTDLPRAPADMERGLAAYLTSRAGGAPNQVGGSVNYLNPHYSSRKSMNAWGSEVVANNTGEFGDGKNIHYHGTAPGSVPMEAGYKLSPELASRFGYSNPETAAGHSILPDYITGHDTVAEANVPSPRMRPDLQGLGLSAFLGGGELPAYAPQDYVPDDVPEESRVPTPRMRPSTADSAPYPDNMGMRQPTPPAFDIDAATDDPAEFDPGGMVPSNELGTRTRSPGPGGAVGIDMLTTPGFQRPSPRPTPDAATATVEAAPVAPTERQTISVPRRVSVQRGESLWKIAERELGDGTRYKELASTNGIKNPRNIKPGTMLEIPGATEEIPVPQARPDYTPRPTIPGSGSGQYGPVPAAPVSPPSFPALYGEQPAQSSPYQTSNLPLYQPVIAPDEGSFNLANDLNTTRENTEWWTGDLRQQSSPPLAGGMSAQIGGAQSGPFFDEANPGNTFRPPSQMSQGFDATGYDQYVPNVGSAPVTARSTVSVSPGANPPSRDFMMNESANDYNSGANYAPLLRPGTGSQVYGTGTMSPPVPQQPTPYGAMMFGEESDNTLYGGGEKPTQYLPSWPIGQVYADDAEEPESPEALSAEPPAPDQQNWAPFAPAQTALSPRPMGGPAAPGSLGMPGALQRVISPAGRGILGAVGTGISKLLGGGGGATFTPTGVSGPGWAHGTTNALGGTNALSWNNSSGNGSVTVAQDPWGGGYYGPSYSDSTW